MTGCRKTAQMLTVSVISMVICSVMLLGTTFAWFHKTVTGSDTIKTGTVSMTLDKQSVAFYEVLLGESSTKTEGENITTLSTEPAAVWDLGKTYQTATMTLANTGSLKTKFTVSIEGIEEALKEAFVFEVLLNGESHEVPFSDELGVDENSGTVSFAIRARLDADKAATTASASLENIVINIIAVQADVEMDSFGNTYDVENVQSAVIEEDKS